MRTVLVCYATRYGSTGEIASIIADELQKHHHTTRVSPISEIIEIEPADAVVIGSPVYMGKWLAEAREFVRKFQDTLRTRPIAVFSVGYTIRDQMREDTGSGQDVLLPIKALIFPLSEGSFAGRVDPDSMTLADREVTKMAGVMPGDFIDPVSVRDWAQRLPGIFFPHST